VAVSTYGRGLYVLRDITRLEQQDQVDADAPAFLYAPRPAFREGTRGSAEFLYSLKAAATDPVVFEIVDASGAAVRKLTGSSRAGLNRVAWDVRHEPPAQVELRTIPPDNPHIWEEARFKGQQTRSIQHWGIQQAVRVGPLAVPGWYTVRMSAGGRRLKRRSRSSRTRTSRLRHRTWQRPLQQAADPRCAERVCGHDQPPRGRAEAD